MNDERPKEAARPTKTVWENLQSVGGGIAAVIGALTALIVALQQCQRNDAPQQSAQVVNGVARDESTSPARVEAGNQPTVTESEGSGPPGTEPTQAETREQDPGRTDRSAQAEKAEAMTPAAAGPPPNARFPHRALIRFRGRAPRIYMVAEPHAGADRVAALTSGDVFYVGTRLGEYYRASTEDGLTGYVPVDLVTVVRETAR